MALKIKVHLRDLQHNVTSAQFFLPRAAFLCDLGKFKNIMKTLDISRVALPSSKTFLTRQLEILQIAFSLLAHYNSRLDFACMPALAHTGELRRLSFVNQTPVVAAAGA